MSMQTAGDIPILVSSENSSSERRITPSWTIGQLKAKLEPVTGIPPLSQKLVLKHGSQSIPIEAADEENTQLASFPLAAYAEILVSLQTFHPRSPVFGFTPSLRETTWDCVWWSNQLQFWCDRLLADRRRAIGTNSVRSSWSPRCHEPFCTDSYRSQKFTKDVFLACQLQCQHQARVTDSSVG